MQYVAIFREQGEQPREGNVCWQTGYLQTGNWKVKLKIIINYVQMIYNQLVKYLFLLLYFYN